LEATVFNQSMASLRRDNRKEFKELALQSAKLERRELKKVNCGFITATPLPDPYIMALNDEKMLHYKPYPDHRMRLPRKHIPF